MYFFATAQKSYQPRAAYSFSGGAKNAAASDPDYRFVRFCKAKPTKSNIGTFLTLHELIFLTHFFRGGPTFS